MEVKDKDARKGGCWWGSSPRLADGLLLSAVSPGSGGYGEREVKGAGRKRGQGGEGGGERALVFVPSYKDTNAIMRMSCTLTNSTWNQFIPQRLHLQMSHWKLGLEQTKIFPTRVEPTFLALAGGFFTTSATWEAHAFTSIVCLSSRSLF